MVFAKTYDSEETRLQAYSECHTRSAQRVLKALLANGGTSAAFQCHYPNIEARIQVFSSSSASTWHPCKSILCSFHLRLH